MSKSTEAASSRATGKAAASIAVEARVDDDEQQRPPPPRPQPPHGASTDDGGAERPYPIGRFSRTLVRYPVAVMLVCFILSCSIAAFGIRSGSLDAMLGFEVEQSIIVRRYFGNQLALLRTHWELEDYNSKLIDVPDEPEWEEDGRGRRRLKDIRRLATLDDCKLPHRQRFEEFDLHVMFRDASGSPLSSRTLESIELAQKLISEIPAYQDTCLRNDHGACAVFNSVVNWASMFGDVTGTTQQTDDAMNQEAWAQCLGVDQSAYEEKVDKVCLKDSAGAGLPVPCSTDLAESAVTYPAKGSTLLESPFRAMCVAGSSQTAQDASACGAILAALRSGMFGKKWNCDTLRSNYVRFVLPAADPAADGCGEGEFSDESWEALWDAWESEIRPALFAIKATVEEQNEDITMYFSNDEPGWSDYYLDKDLELLMVSFLIVFIVLWYNVDSFFLTCCGMFEIMVSFPLGLFVWVVLMGEPGVTVLMYNGIFVIMGIGCDDIFVFNDAFRQSRCEPRHISGSLETRFAWSYQRSAFAMLATSLTTGLAFGACGLSQIWDLRCFGVVNGFMVMFDYLLVITWYPSAVVVHERYMKNCIPWFSLRKACQCCSAAPFAVWRKAFARGEAQTGPMDGEEEMRMIRGGGEAEEKVEGESESKLKKVKVVEKHPEDEEDFLTIEERLERRARLKAQGTINMEGEPEKYGALETWLSGPYFDFIVKWARVIVAGYALLFVGCATVAIVVLKPDNKPFSFFNDDHMVPMLGRIVRKKFDYTPMEGNEYLHLSFGLDKHDPWHRAEEEVHITTVFEDEFYYEKTPMRAKFDHSFDLFYNQEAYLTFCDSFLQQMITKGEATAGADQINWFSDFKQWSIAKGYAFPFTERDAFDAATDAWVDASSTEEHSFQKRREEIDEYEWYTFFGKKDDGRVYYTAYQFETSLPWVRAGHTNARMWEFYRNNQAALKAAQDASGLRGGVQTSDRYRQMVLSSYLTTSSFQSLGVSLAIAGLVFFAATLNWWLASLSFAFLLVVIAMVFAEMAFLGWKINMVEAIDITICGGLAVDFVLHMTHSFNHHSGLNVDRARSAMRDMGVSIAAGVVTTFCACFVLFFTQMTVFNLFGSFIAMVVCSGFVVTMTGLVAALAVLGPSNEEGQVQIELPTKLQQFLGRQHMGGQRRRRDLQVARRARMGPLGEGDLEL